MLFSKLKPSKWCMSFVSGIFSIIFEIGSINENW